MNIKKLLKYFTITDYILWTVSIISITTGFLLFDSGKPLTLITSLIGVTALIFLAKGSWIGQVLLIIFAVLYGIISFECAYYGEMLTYLGMSAPMAIVVLVAWIKNPYGNKKTEVKINTVGKKTYLTALIFSLTVTVVFYFLLKWLGTASLLVSTISVTTSFFAAYLTYKRTPFYALAYSLNDIVLIILWAIATVKNTAYLSVVICFITFLANDIYGFVCWQKMQKRQKYQMDY